MRIAGHISNARKTEWQRAIDKFLKDPPTADDERNVEELERWYNDEIEVKKSIEDLRNTTEEVREEIVRLGVKLRAETHAITESVQCLQTAVHEATGRIGEIHQSMNRLSSSAASYTPAAGKEL